MNKSNNSSRIGRGTARTVPGAADGGGKPSIFALLLLASVYITVVVLGIQVGNWIIAQLEVDIHLSAETDAFWRRVVLIAFFSYVALMMLPFVPAIEIGLTMLVIFGGDVALLVYVGTVLALTLSFLIGMLVPERAIAWTFERLHLRRAHALVTRLEALPTEERLRYLLEALPTRSLNWLIKFRFVAIGLLLNVPGNVLVGGGGGIALAAGMSRLFTFSGFLITILIAIAPVPLLLTLTDAISG